MSSEPISEQSNGPTIPRENRDSKSTKQHNNLSLTLYLHMHALPCPVFFPPPKKSFIPGILAKPHRVSPEGEGLFVLHHSIHLSLSTH